MGDFKGSEKLNATSRLRLTEFGKRVSEQTLKNCLRFIEITDFQGPPSVFLSDDLELELLWREQPGNTAVIAVFLDNKFSYYNERTEEEYEKECIGTSERDNLG
jgi:hypothetical protein